MRNGAHDFEVLCRHVARARLVSNVLPATGPIGAGGDQGRDFETFRTYLREELGAHSAFLARVADGPVAFACTLQKDGLPAKIRADVGKITSSGTAVEMVYVFLAAPLAVGPRHELQAQLQSEYGVMVEILDSFALAEWLVDRELFWIAEEYLRLPAALAPQREEAVAEGGVPAWYTADRDRWRGRGRANATLGEVLDLRDGLRYATYRTDARADLPFWVGMMNELTGDEVPRAVRRRAQYEIAIAQLVGAGDLGPADGHVAAFLDEAVASEDAVRLGDAIVLLTFATSAFTYRRTALTREQLVGWNAAIRMRVQGLLSDDVPPTIRARLLEVLVHVCLSRDPARVPQAVEPVRPPDASELVDDEGRPRVPKGMYARRAIDEMVDAREGMRVLRELTEALLQTPLFPVDGLATLLELLAPVLVDELEWRAVTDAIDEAVARAEGGAAAAMRSHARAAALVDAGRMVDAISEIHRARMDWWSGNHVRPLLITQLLLAKCYVRLNLPQAAKQYALGALALASQARQDDVADLVPHALLEASSHDYTAGNWCSALQLADLGLHAQATMIDAEVDPWYRDDLNNAVMTLGMALRASRQLLGADSSTAAHVADVAERHGMLEQLNEVDAATDAWSRDEWLAGCDKDLLGRPFDDLGAERVIRFAALGQHWTVRCNNRWADVFAAERLAAAAQVLLVELAHLDLCLLSTDIEVRVILAAVADGDRTCNVSNNDGRRWVVALTPYDGAALDPDDVARELLTVLSTVLLDMSLLKRERFFDEIEPAFASGLIGKLTAGRPYDELAAVIDAERFAELDRTSIAPPGGVRDRVAVSSTQLPWNDAPTPTASQQELTEMLETRYEQLPRLMARTLARLRADRRFQTTVTLLRRRGWRDWHILTATYNILLQRRLAAAGLNTADVMLSPAGARAATDLAYTPETEDEPEAPLGPFINVQTMNEARQMALGSQLRNLGLEIHGIPDLPAIERFLAARYGYWNDDIKHDDALAAIVN